MTNAEQAKINELSTLLRNIREENIKFREDVNNIVNSVNRKVDEKHLPITLEQEILNRTKNAIGEVIDKALTGYQNPLSKLVEQVVVEHNTELKKVINESFEQVISTTDFKNSILQGLTHKIAKSIVSGGDSMIDKTVQELKSNPEFKAKMILAVSTVVNEIIKK